MKIKLWRYVALILLGGTIVGAAGVRLWLMRLYPWQHTLGVWGFVLMGALICVHGMNEVGMTWKNKHGADPLHWWRGPVEATPPVPMEGPPAKVKLWFLPVLMAAWVPLMYLASPWWEVLVVLMGAACWQQTQSEPRSFLWSAFEHIGWLLACAVFLVFFPRDVRDSAFSTLGLATLGSFSWMMMVARGQWRLLWAGFFGLMGAIPIVAHVLHWDWILLFEIGLGLALMMIMPALTRIEKATSAAWPKGAAPHSMLWIRVFWLGMFVFAIWLFSGWITRPVYSLDLGPSDINQSGPPDGRGDTIVFAVRIGKQDSDAGAKLYDTNDWYWRGNVLYTLDGSMWRRPSVRSAGYNADYPYPVRATWADRDLRYYMVTWAGPIGTHVWLDRPLSSDTINGGSVALPPAEPSTVLPPPPVGTPPPPPPEPFTRDGISREDQFPTTDYNTWFYPGIAALNQPIQDSGQRPEDRAWTLNLTPHTIENPSLAKTGELENPQTRALAQKIFNRLPVSTQADPKTFLKAWLIYLDQHTVYDLDRSSAGARRDVSDAFLFGSETPHGTCVDFATSTVIALRQVGIPARYVTGFHGGTWNPYLKAWVVTNGDAHAWVEYLDPSTQSWMRADPTAAIHRVVKSTSTINDWAMWIQSITNRRLAPIRGVTQGPEKADLLSWINDLPFPSVHLSVWARLCAGTSVIFFLLVTSLTMWRRWHKKHPEPPQQRRLRRAIWKTQKRLERIDMNVARHSYEGLTAWAERVQASHPEWPDVVATAALTQRFFYGVPDSNMDIQALRYRWQRLGR